MKVKQVDQLKLDRLEKGKVYRFWLNMVSDSFAQPTSIPVFYAKGVENGPTLGITSSLHGNEINGVPVIQRLFRKLEIDRLKGNILAIPVVNIPSFFRKRRRFPDNVDLNHIMPGKAKGNVSQVYAYHFFEKVIRKMDYLIDLHTASFGRINSYYVRADMSSSITAKMALVQNAQIILNNPASDGTLRGAAQAIGIPTITPELGNPNIFQPEIIDQALTGMYNTLTTLGLYEAEIRSANHKTVICRGSKWIYTTHGGLLQVRPKVTQMVKEGELIAHQEDVFGDLLQTYHAPKDGIVIGKSVSPVNTSGGRILHLGFVDSIY
jgi:predicted deacylase